VTTELATAASLALKQELWRRGEAWKHPDICDDLQRAWLQRVRTAVDKGRRGSFLQRWGRQVGKSWANIAFALSEMQRRPGIIIRYAALTGKSCLAIVKPTFEALEVAMPQEIRPVLLEQKGTIAAPNGSVMVFAGTDAEQFDRLRGPKAHLIMLDESSFYAELERVEAALLPQLNTTHGLVLYFSTPPESPAHPWTRRDAAHQASGDWSKETVYTCPRYSQADVVEIEEAEAKRLLMTRDALLASTWWRREYHADIVTEETRAALPAWTDEAAAALVAEWQRPAHFDAYTSADPGKTGDPHATLFGFHDFATNTVTIEDELELRSATTHVGAWATELQAKESTLWGVNRWEGTLSGVGLEQLKDLDEKFHRVYSANAPRQPFLRVSDNDSKCTVDMALQHGVAFLPSDRHDKWQWVDTVNQLIRERRLRIHPRCVRLLEQMRSTLWNRTRSEWERTDRDHGDLVDCTLAGTMVETSTGPRAIETLRSGDLVWTRFGLRKVITSARTKKEAPIWRVEASNGAVVFATADHPFFVDGQWVRLQDLTVSSILLAWFAAPPSSRTTLAAPPHAVDGVQTRQVLVRDVRPTGLLAATYNLHVEGDHEYFANGILVHNCLVYLCRNVRWHRDCRPPPMVDRGLQLAMAAMRGPGPDFGLMVGRRRR